MKKIIASALAAIMALSATATAFAADTVVTPDPDNGYAPNPATGESSVTFSVAPTYTVTIPAEIVLEKTGTDVITYEKDLTITASAGVRLLEGMKIMVTMDSDFMLDTAASATYKLPYTVEVGGQEITAENNQVALFGTSEAEQTSVLHFAAGNPTYAGDYSDTVTFNIDMAEETVGE